MNKYYEFVLLSQLIKDKTSYNDYYLDEEEIITDILKDTVQGISIEKGSRLVHRVDYEVNPIIEKEEEKANEDKNKKTNSPLEIN